MQRKLLYTAVFFSGLTSLAVEMAASRLLGNYFGAGLEVWASIIGLILLYLTAGYFLGGRWADRSPNPATFYRILIWAGFTVGLIPIISRPVLRFAATAFDELAMGAAIGAFASVLILFVVPIILMGTASPFAIRLAIQDARKAGQVSGRIYAISTLGSFLGTFLPVLLLIPNIGTFRTFLVLGGLLVAVALICTWLAVSARSALIYLWMPVVLVLLAIFGMPGHDKNFTGMIYEGESAYNYIQVLDLDGYRYLRLNEGQGVHSMWHPTQLDFHGPWEQVLAGPFLNAPPFDPSSVHSMAIVGLAAGTTARAATAVFGNRLAIDGFEIDPLIVKIARKYFDMNEPNLNVILQDGRWGLERSQRRYDIISVDAYRPPYIPWHMTTREFFQIARDHLTSNGVLVINVGRMPDDRRLVDAFSATLGSVFPSVYVMDIPDTFNSIIYATIQPTDWSNLDTNLAYLNNLGTAHPLLLRSINTALANHQPTTLTGQVFTDDRAPIEWITSSMIYQFFLSGEAKQLQ
jgi:predicted membrane-bound spermidine synthase